MDFQVDGNQQEILLKDVNLIEGEYGEKIGGDKVVKGEITM